MANNVMKQLNCSVVPTEVEGARLLSFIGSDFHKSYLNTRCYQGDKQAESAFMDGFVWCINMMMTSPNQIRNVLVYEEDTRVFVTKVK